MYYKFLDAEHVKNVLVDGTVLISSLAYFRDLENQADAWIGDRLEGRSETVITDLLVPSSGSAEATLLENSFLGDHRLIRIGENARNNRFINCTVSYQSSNYFIYSASWGNPLCLGSIFADKTPGHYNACLRIRNFHRLETHIFARGFVQDLGCPVAEFFTRGGYDLVSYKHRSIYLEDGPIDAPSPFVKDPKFSSQSEARIIFVPQKETELKRLFIKIPAPERFFEQA